MDHSPYIIAAYVLGLGGLLAMLGWCILSLRRAERAIDTEERS